MTELHRFNEIYDFLSAPEFTEQPTGAVVFGRKDPLVAHRFADLSDQGRVKWAVITGGTGKDSGDLTVPEAEYLAQEAEKYAEGKGIILPPVYLETQATNGAENARNSLTVMRRAQLGERTLTAIAHAISLRRLGHMMEHEAIQTDVPLDQVYREPSRYDFDANNPAHQQEALGEMNRLISWPNKGWLQPNVADEIPENLVDFVQDKTK